MAKRAYFFRFIIAFHRALACIPLDNGNKRFRPFGMNGASGHGHDTVRAFRIKAKHGVAVFIYADRHLQFVSISIRQITLNRRWNVHANPADLTKRVFHDLAFM